MNPPSAAGFARLLKKLGARLRGGKALAHAHTWRPHLELVKPLGPMPGSILYRNGQVGALSPSSVLPQKPAALYLVGSGPSVANNDLFLIDDRTAILLNGAITLIGGAIKQPLAIAIEDERFVHRHFPMMQSKIPPASLCLLSVEVIRAICGRQPAWLGDKTVVLIDNLRKPYDAPFRPASALQALDFTVLDADAGISLDPDRGVFPGGSVAVSVLQFALSRDPATIGLFGIDISNAAQPRFYETGRDTAKSGVARAQARIVAHFALAKSIADKRGIGILNFSSVSVLRAHGFPYDNRFEKAGTTHSQGSL